MKDVDLQDVLYRWFRSSLEGVHTAIPASIVSYSGHKKREAVVQPLVHFRGRDGFVVPYGPVSGVPVMFPGTSRSSMLYDLKNGDTGILLVTESGIGNWLAGDGKAVEPEDASRFSLQDAVFVPGLFPFANVPDHSAPDSGMWLNYQGTTMEFKESGGLKITGNVEIVGTVDVEGDTTITGAMTATMEVTAMNAVPAAAVKLSTHIHPSPAGPTSPPTPGT